MTYRNKRGIGTKFLFALVVVGVFIISWTLTRGSLTRRDMVFDRERTPIVALVRHVMALESTTTPAVIDSEPALAKVDAVSADASVTHVLLPEDVRGVYMSQCLAGAPKLRAELVSFVETSALNSLVIDIKDFSGGISFPTDDPLLKENVSEECGANDMKAFVANLHKRGIYVIGRITVFQDPTYTKQHPSEAVQSSKGGVWKNYGGLFFVDVGSTQFWDYIVRLSEVSYKQIGFDELNYDYVRFPSDGPLSEAVYTLSKGKKRENAVEEFFQYLHKRIQPEGSEAGRDAPYISADLFGMVSSHYDDLGIGQILEKAMPYFDFIDPMMYPSHYPKGFDGYSDVNAHYYDLVRRESTAASQRAIAAGYSAKKIRPWLQSFDYPVAYTPKMVQGQIDAAKEGGLTTYLFWDAANKYTSLREVLQ